MQNPPQNLVHEWEGRLAEHGLSKKQLDMPEPRYWGKAPETSCPEETCFDCGGRRFKLIESQITEGAFFWRCRDCDSDVAVDVTE